MHTKSRNKGDAAKLEMTPMIDVVFQLLIFFIVTLKQDDILAHLDVSRPEPSPMEIVETELLTITVHRDGYVMDERPISKETLDRRLTRLSTFSKDISIAIKCTPDSSHDKLIALLDICAKTELDNLSVFSM
ncbi:MAG: biopolymer transporter ExbD [Kiritimatiellae bacterium]|nr:biopolymer transporter ExbD [Kiritimatiellia bacterium]